MTAQKFANLVELGKMLQNAYFLAKIGFDTAESKPAKKLQILAELMFNVAKFCQC